MAALEGLEPGPEWTYVAKPFDRETPRGQWGGCCGRRRIRRCRGMGAGQDGVGAGGLGSTRKGVGGGGVADAEADFAGEGGFEGVAADLGAPAAQEAGEGVRVAATQVPVDQAAEIGGTPDEGGGDVLFDARGFEQGFQDEGEHAFLAGTAPFAAAGGWEVLGGEGADGIEGVEDGGAVAVREAFQAADTAEVIGSVGHGL